MGDGPKSYFSIRVGVSRKVQNGQNNEKRKKKWTKNPTDEEHSNVIYFRYFVEPKIRPN